VVTKNGESDLALYIKYMYIVWLYDSNDDGLSTACEASLSGKASCFGFPRYTPHEHYRGVWDLTIVQIFYDNWADRCDYYYFNL
jgi:hypothetical protein